MKLFPRHSLRHWRALAGAVALATVAQLLVLADPRVLRLIVDRYVMHLHEMPRDVFLRGVLLLVGASLVLTLLARIARNLQEYRMNVVARRVGSQLDAATVAHSLLLPFRIYEDRRAGELMHTMQRARQDAEQSISYAVRLYVGAVAMIAIAAYAFSINPILGALQTGLIVAKVNRRTRRSFRSPEVLIFDEATSNLDSLTERAVSDTIRELAASQPRRSTLLIAHRLGTVAGADRIHALDHGEIVESGTHTDLLARGGLYARMWREQSEHAKAVPHA